MKYLSIGEMAKLSGVGIKALRYYNELGILAPAYINLDTGYRYYTLDQIYLIDTIQFCVELGIPLKEFERYKDKTNRILLDNLINDGLKLAQKKIETINKIANKLKRVQLYLEEGKNIKDENFLKEIEFDERHILVIPCSRDEIFNEYIFINYTTKLYSLAKKYGVTSFSSGYIMGKRDYIFIEIDNALNFLENYLYIPKGKYYSNIVSRESCETIESDYDTILLTALLNEKFNGIYSYFRVQYLEKI